MDTIIKKRSWIKRNRYTTIGATSLIFFISYLILFSDNYNKQTIDKETISISTVEYSYFQEFINVTGNVEPIRTIILAAIERGRVEEIYIEESNKVKKGDTIIRLSNPNLILEISNNEAQVIRSINDLQMTKLNMQTNMMEVRSRILDMELELIDKKRTYNINKELYKEKLISHIDYKESIENYNTTVKKIAIIKERQKNDSTFYSIQIHSLGQSIERMEKNLKLVSKRIENLYVKAPYDGELAQLKPEIGQVIDYGSSIGKINILTSYKLRIDIDEHYISRIYKNIHGKCLFANKEYSGIIKKIYTEVEKGKFHVDMIFNNDIPKDIRIGQTTRIKLELGKAEKKIIIPRGAFYQNTGGNWIYVVSANGKLATKRNIEIGRYNPQYYEILNGLKEGEQIITSGYDTFGDKEKIILK